MKRMRRGIVFVFVLVIVCGLSAGALWLAFRDRSLEALRESGIIRIGYAVEAPFAFLSPDGQVTGEAPEVAKRVVSRLGIQRIEWRQSEFGHLIAELESGRIDVIASGMFITRERALKIAFSEPTFHVRQSLLVARGNPHGLQSYRQAATGTGARIAVLSGAIEESLLRKMGMAEPRLVLVPDALTGRVAVESGLADGLALSSPTIRWMALHDQLGKTEMLEAFDPASGESGGQTGYGAFGFRRADAELLAAWNAALKPFVGSPEHLELIARFGFTRSELPVNATTREILFR